MWELQFLLLVFYFFNILPCRLHQRWPSFQPFNQPKWGLCVILLTVLLWTQMFNWLMKVSKLPPLGFISVESGVHAFLNSRCIQMSAFEWKCLSKLANYNNYVFFFKCCLFSLATAVASVSVATLSSPLFLSASLARAFISFPTSLPAPSYLAAAFHSWWWEWLT